METKLTLKLDAELIEKAKRYAKNHDESLSKVVENFFRFLPEDNVLAGTGIQKEEIKITPWVKKLSGSIPANADYKFKQEKLNRLLEKYK